MGERFLIDTNVFLYAIGNYRISPEIKSFLTGIFSIEINISVITKIELLGFGNLKVEEEQKINSLLLNTQLLALTDEIIDRTILVRRSRKIKIPDAIIAATSVELGLTLVTRNISDFKDIQGLKVLNPFEL